MRLTTQLNDSLNAVLRKTIDKKLELIPSESPLFGLSTEDILNTKVSFLVQSYSGMEDHEGIILVKALPEKIYNMFDFNNQQPLVVIISLIKDKLESIIKGLFAGNIINDIKTYLYEEFELDNNGFNIDSNVEVLVVKLV